MDTEDGALSALLKAARKKETGDLKYLMSRTTKTKFADGHMLASVFMRPFRSSFTRAQRLTCLMAGFFLTMVTRSRARTHIRTY